MFHQVKSRFYQLSRPSTIRAMYLLAAIVAIALAAGAPIAWGGGGGG